MIDDSKKYWMTIEPYVFMSSGEMKKMLYNTLDGNTIIVENPTVTQLLSELYSRENIGAILLTEEHLIDNEIKIFINELRNNFMGDIIDISRTTGKPIQFVPILNLQRDVKKIKQENNTTIGVEIINYLQEITLNLKDCIYTVDELAKSILSINFGGIYLLNNLWDYSEPEKLIFLFNQKPNSKISGISYLRIDSPILFSALYENFSFRITVEFPVVAGQWVKAWDILSRQDYPFDIIFKVTSNEDCNHAEQIINEYKIENYRLEPVFIGSNLHFFQENVYLSKEDILSIPLKMREIFAHQALNTSNFGKITIMPNGDVRANINHPPLGNIAKDSIYRMLYQEMNEGKSWLRIRDQAPCNTCIYQWLCPSPSDYEIVIGKPNLCHIEIDS